MRRCGKVAMAAWPLYGCTRPGKRIEFFARSLDCVRAPRWVGSGTLRLAGHSLCRIALGLEKEDMCTDVPGKLGVNACLCSVGGREGRLRSRQCRNLEPMRPGTPGTPGTPRARACAHGRYWPMTVAVRVRRRSGHRAPPAGAQARRRSLDSNVNPERRCGAARALSPRGSRGVDRWRAGARWHPGAAGTCWHLLALLEPFTG